MIDKEDDHDWHEFPWGDAPALPPGQHKKLKLFADANIPKPLIDELRAAGLAVDSAVEMGIASHPDGNIAQAARKLGIVILTMDSDFWDDRRHPMQKSPGIIFVNIPPDQVDIAIDGLARFYALFAKEFPLDWWYETKARVTEKGFVIRIITSEGGISEDEFQESANGKLLTRKIR